VLMRVGVEAMKFPGYYVGSEPFTSNQTAARRNRTPIMLPTFQVGFARRCTLTSPAFEFSLPI